MNAVVRTAGLSLVALCAFAPLGAGEAQLRADVPFLETEQYAVPGRKPEALKLIAVLHAKQPLTWDQSRILLVGHEKGRDGARITQLPRPLRYSRVRSGARSAAVARCSRSLAG